MIITIDLRRVPALDHDRTPLFKDKEDTDLAFALSKFVLANAKSGSASKMVRWCWHIADNEPLVFLDEADFKLLQDTVKAAEIVDLLKGQLEIAMEKAKEQSDRDQKALDDKKRAEAEAEKQMLEEFRKAKTDAASTEKAE